MNPLPKNRERDPLNPPHKNGQGYTLKPPLKNDEGPTLNLYIKNEERKKSMPGPCQAPNLKSFRQSNCF